MGATALGRLLHSDLPGCFASPFALEHALALQNGRRYYLDPSHPLGLVSWFKRHIRRVLYDRDWRAYVCGQNSQLQFRVCGRSRGDPFYKQDQMGTAAYLAAPECLHFLLIGRQAVGGVRAAGKADSTSSKVALSHIPASLLHIPIELLLDVCNEVVRLPDAHEA